MNGPVLTAATNDLAAFSCLGISLTASGARIRRLELVGGYYYALLCYKGGAGGIIVEDCKIHGSGSDCIHVNANDVTVRRCEVYESGKRDATNAQLQPQMDVVEAIQTQSS
jgi:hypothetical protein